MEIFNEGVRIGFENLKNYNGRDIEIAFKDNTPVAIAEKVDGKIARRATFSLFLGKEFIISEIIINPSTDNNKKLPPFSKGIIGNSWSCDEHYSFDVLRRGALISHAKNYCVSAFGNEKSDEEFLYNPQDLSKLGKYRKNASYGLFSSFCDEEIDFNKKQNLIIYKKGVNEGQKKTKEEERIVLGRNYNIYYKNPVSKKDLFYCEEKVIF